MVMDIGRPDLKRGKRLKQLLVTMAAIVVACVLVVLAARQQPAVPRVDSNALWIGTVQKGEFVRQVRGTGSLVPRETRWVSSDSAGRVERILVRPGAWVEPDTVLVELSNPELIQEVEELRWEFDARKAGLASLEAELERQLLDARAAYMASRSDLESVNLEAQAEEELARKGIVSRIQHQQTLLRVGQLAQRVELESERIAQLRKSIDSQLDAEKARLEQTRKQLERHEQRIVQLQVQGGVAGVLQRIDVEPGQQIERGVNIARVARQDELIAELRVPESQAREIQLGQAVSVDMRGSRVSGEIVRIDPAVVGGAVQVDVRIVDDLPAGARPDLSVDGTIMLERLEDVMFVGRPAFGQPESTVSLFRVEENGQARRVMVELGRASLSEIEVRSGLVPGDRVVLSDTARWNGQERIRLD
jgi:HlyD family secretion protein